MPITPRFTLQQTNDDIILVIDVPHIRVNSKSFEIVIEDDHILHFYSNPYLLKLVFGSNDNNDDDVNDDDCYYKFASNAEEECATYDPGGGGGGVGGTPSGVAVVATLTLKLRKFKPGIHWPNLDLTARLLSPKPIPTKYLQQHTTTTTSAASSSDSVQRKHDWLKQVIDNNDTVNDVDDDNNDGTTTTTNDMVRMYTTDCSYYDGYGFGNMYRNIFCDFVRDDLAKEMLQLTKARNSNNNSYHEDDDIVSSISLSPEKSTCYDRYYQRLQHEKYDFDSNHYLGDLFLHYQYIISRTSTKTDDDDGDGDGDDEDGGDEDYLYKVAMEYVPHWKRKSMSTKKTKQQQQHEDDDQTLANKIQRQLNIQQQQGGTYEESSSSPSCTTTSTTCTTPDKLDGVGGSDITTTNGKYYNYFTSDEQLQLATIPYPLLPSNQELIATVMSAKTTIQSEGGCGDGESDDGDKNLSMTTTPPPTSIQTVLWPSLIDILFAYVYDHIITQGEPTVESPWNISILSCSLSYLDNGYCCGYYYDDNDRDTKQTSSYTSVVDDDDKDRKSKQTIIIRQTVISSLRRMLIYPYIRNLEFGIYIWNQVCDILSSEEESSRKCIIRCLLQVRKILESSDSYYLGNKLYIDPYLAWLQRENFDTNTNANVVGDDDDDAMIPGQQFVIDTIRNTIQGQSLVDLKQCLGLGLLECEKQLEEEEDDDDDGNDNGNNENPTTNATTTTDSEEESSTDSDESDSESDDSDDDDDNDEKSETHNERNGCKATRGEARVEGNLCEELDVKGKLVIEGDTGGSDLENGSNKISKILLDSELGTNQPTILDISSTAPLNPDSGTTTAAPTTTEPLRIVEVRDHGHDSGKPSHHPLKQQKPRPLIQEMD